MNTSTKDLYKILFLCTGNSARSILAEYLGRRIGSGRFECHSAGSKPKGQVHPMAVQVLRDFFNIDASDARSKSMDEFTNQTFDFVITLCDSAKEECPLWPGNPIVAHWSSEDPAAIEGDAARSYQAFRAVGIQIQRRLELLACLPIEKLDRIRLETMTKEIGFK